MAINLGDLTFSIEAQGQEITNHECHATTVCNGDFFGHRHSRLWCARLTNTEPRDPVKQHTARIAFAYAPHTHVSAPFFSPTTSSHDRGVIIAIKDQSA